MGEEEKPKRKGVRPPQEVFCRIFGKKTAGGPPLIVSRAVNNRCWRQLASYWVYFRLLDDEYSVHGVIRAYTLKALVVSAEWRRMKFPMHGLAEPTKTRAAARWVNGLHLRKALKLPEKLSFPSGFNRLATMEEIMLNYSGLDINYWNPWGAAPDPSPIIVKGVGKFWGVDDRLHGRNHLGTLLMKLLHKERVARDTEHCYRSISTAGSTHIRQRLE